MLLDMCVLNRIFITGISLLFGILYRANICDGAIYIGVFNENEINVDDNWCIDREQCIIIEYGDS
jgi:hypothetical protein